MMDDFGLTILAIVMGISVALWGVSTLARFDFKRKATKTETERTPYPYCGKLK